MVRGCLIRCFLLGNRWSRSYNLETYAGIPTCKSNTERLWAIDVFDAVLLLVKPVLERSMTSKVLAPESPASPGDSTIDFSICIKYWEISVELSEFQLTSEVYSLRLISPPHMQLLRKATANGSALVEDVFKRSQREMRKTTTMIPKQSKHHILKHIPTISYIFTCDKNVPLNQCDISWTLPVCPLSKSMGPHQWPTVCSVKFFILGG